MNTEPDGPGPAALDGGVPLADLLAAVRPPADLAERFRQQGWWRTDTVLHDLYRGAAAHPDRPAVIAHRAHRPPTARTVRLSYAQLAGYVDRFAYALASLGIRPGDPVAYQLPNWWESTALFFACLRVGSIAVPLLPTYGTKDMQAVLTAAQPRLCVVPDLWGGAPLAEALADLVPHLPYLRHRVVIGDAAATRATDFDSYFVHTPHERRRSTGWLPLPSGAADRTCLIVSTVGLRESHAMFMHSPNTLYASLSTVGGSTSGGVGGGSGGAPAGAVSGAGDGGPGDARVCYTALPVASLPSFLHAVIAPIVSGGTCVLQDVWDPATALDLLADGGVGHAYAMPLHWSELAAERQRRGGPEPTALRRALSADPASTTTRLVRQVHDALHVPLQVSWGTPELGLAAGPPEDTAAATPAGTSDPAADRTPWGVETALDPVGNDGPGTGGDGDLYRLRMRGPSSCLAVWGRGRDGLSLTWEHENGWRETGELVSVDEHGELRVVSRDIGEVGGLFLLPVVEIEDRLLRHPAVREAAVVAYNDPRYGELACAVVVPEGAPPDLNSVRRHLADLGVTEAHLPTRLELVGGLPRSDHGEVRRGELSDRLNRRPPPRARPQRQAPTEPPEPSA
ncbi:MULTISPECIES: AMP-binding protein [unclassified Streptomyces]|uniref:AMP-binding protein n=1 Tax=unclassified Streptomyces TaxID=2593676 RepID=UPI002E2B0B27|nr:AMP-binding protein [Streptomyces sp. NBC_00223]